MKKQILAGVTLAALVSTSHAGVTAGSTGSTVWPGSPTLVTIPDPLSTGATTGEGFSAGRQVISETFKANTSFTLDKISIWADGAGGTGLSLRLVDLGPVGSSPGSYNSGVDLFSGLSFTFNGSTRSVYSFDFTGVDEVSLTAGNTYAFEITQASGAGGLLWYRGGLTDTYTDGTGYVSATTGGTRSLINGNVRDFAMAVYAVPVPEPGSLALLGLAAVTGGILYRRRRSE